MTDLFLAAGFLVLFAAGIVWFEVRQSRTDKHLDKLGPRALDKEFVRQREARKDKG